MSTKSHVRRKTTAVLAIIFVLPPIILYLMWASVGIKYSGISEGDQMDVYMSYFPVWLKSINTIHLISIICSFIAIVLAARSFKKHLLWVRVLMLAIVLIAIFIILFDISQII